MSFLYFNFERMLSEKSWEVLVNRSFAISLNVDGKHFLEIINSLYLGLSFFLSCMKILNMTEDRMDCNITHQSTSKNLNYFESKETDFNRLLTPKELGGITKILI